MSAKAKYLSRVNSAVKQARRWRWLWRQEAFMRGLERRRAAGNPDVPPRKLSLMPASAFRLYLTGLSMLIGGLCCQMVCVEILIRLFTATGAGWRRYAAWEFFFALLGWLLIYGAARIIRSEKLRFYL